MVSFIMAASAGNFYQALTSLGEIGFQDPQQWTASYSLP
ncbi:unnamed protein product, partial [Vitis vinifera]